MQQEHIQWQRKQDQILHMRQQAGGGQRFSRKKAARAGAQRLSPAGRMTWWEKGRKWRCHYSAQWQNDIQEKTIMEPGRTKIQLCKQTQHRQSYISKIFSKSPRIYLRVFSDFVLLSIHAYLWDECFFTTYFEQTCPPLYSQGKTQWVIERSRTAPPHKALRLLPVAGGATYSGSCLSSLWGEALPSSSPPLTQGLWLSTRRKAVTQGHLVSSGGGGVAITRWTNKVKGGKKRASIT